MAGGRKQDDEGPQISPEEQARIAKAAKQVAAYANFLRWAANFRKDEITRHPKTDKVMMLSPMLSGRFSYCIEGDTIYLGAQPFEAAWLSAMPIAKAYVSDRLYLSVEGVGCMDSKLPPLGIGVFMDDQRKRAHIASAKWLQVIRVQVRDGVVCAVENQLGQRIEITRQDIVLGLKDAAKAKLEQQDMSRYF